MVDPHGFRESAGGSGLLVPEDVSREREVFTKDEWRLIDRAAKLLQSRKIATQMRCTDLRCQGLGSMTMGVQDDGARILRCGHADRIFQKAF